MAKVEKELAPPTYEEAMYTSTAPPPPPTIGILYPNVGHPSAPPPLNMQPGYVPSYGAFETTPVNIIVQPAPVALLPADLIGIGGCPACRIGVMEDAYPCLGLLCAIAFFPIGILCCLAMKTKRCSNCGTEL